MCVFLSPFIDVWIFVRRIICTCRLLLFAPDAWREGPEYVCSSTVALWHLGRQYVGTNEDTETDWGWHSRPSVGERLARPAVRIRARLHDIPLRGAVTLLHSLGKKSIAVRLQFRLQDGNNSGKCLEILHNMMPRSKCHPGVSNVSERNPFSFIWTKRATCLAASEIYKYLYNTLR